MRKIFQTSFIAAAAALAISLCGCGYHIGFIKHPQLNTLAVAPAVNETAVYNAASDVRMMMNEVVVQDGTFKLVDQKSADAVIFMTVKRVSYAEVSEASVTDRDTYRPNEWAVNVAVEYSVIIPGQAGAIRSGTVEGSTLFQAATDIESSRLRAVRQASYNACRKILYNIAEGW